MIYLATMMLEALRNLGLESSTHTIIFPSFLYPLNAIIMMASIYMTMVIGLERLGHCIIYPLHYIYYVLKVHSSVQTSGIQYDDQRRQLPFPEADQLHPPHLRLLRHLQLTQVSRQEFIKLSREQQNFVNIDLVEYLS